MNVDFRLLGAMAVSVDGRPVVIRSARQRVLLAALLVRAGQFVPADVLIDTIWSEQPPATARNTLQVYVMRLRQALGPADRVVTRDGGYLVDVPADAVDIGEFAALTREARARAGAGDVAGEFDRLSAALDLWRGPAFADVDAPALHRDYGTALQEERLAVAERRFDVGLALGQHAELVPALTAATAEHPYRERFWSQRMLALYRSGRQAEALSAYREVARRLAEELGIDPGEELRATHESILRSEPPAGAGPTVPAQLPPVPSGFRGRDAELAQLDRLLLGGGRVAVIAGVGGVGKTALALRWGHRVADRFPDGALYADLRGYDPEQEPAAPAHVLDGFLRALGSAQLPADPAERAALYRSLAGDRRLLIVLDNARSSAQVRPLLPGSDSSRVVVTSRDRLDGLVARDGAGLVPLTVLDPAAAAGLLTSLVPAGQAGSAQAARRLARQCDGLPLALRIAAARVVINPFQTLDSLADELADESTRLARLSLEDGDSSVRAALDLSYAALPPGPARLLRAVGLSPGPDVSVAGASALLGAPAADDLEVLDRAHLVRRVGADRFGLHDLVRAYARERSAADGAAAQEATQRRIVDWLLAGAAAVTRLIGPTAMHRPVELARPPDTPPEFNAIDDAMRWMDAERDLVIEAIELCHQRGWHRASWQLASKTYPFLNLQLARGDAEQICRTGLRSARAGGDAEGEALMLSLLGLSATDRLANDEAIEHLTTALRIAERLGDDRMRCRIEGSLGSAYRNNGQPERAAQLLRQAARTARSGGDEMVAVYQEINLSDNLRERGEWDEAAKVLSGLREIAASHGDFLALAAIDLGRSEHAEHDGDMALATASAAEGLRNARLGRQSEQEARCLDRLGSCYLTRDRIQALNCWRLALDIYEAGDHPDAVKIRAKIAAATRLNEGRADTDG